MIHEFSRTELLIGEAGLNKLKQSTIMVFGVGGVGSHCIEALARSGVGRLILIDPDEVALTNLNRQSIAYHSTIGQHKTKVMAARIQDIHPEAEVITFERLYFQTIWKPYLKKFPALLIISLMPLTLFLPNWLLPCMPRNILSRCCFHGNWKQAPRRVV